MRRADRLFQIIQSLRGRRRAVTAAQLAADLGVSDRTIYRDIRDLVFQLKKRGIGVLVTDHNVRETLELVDRAYILHDGRVLMEGAPNEIVHDAEVRRVFLGDRFTI